MPTHVHHVVRVVVATMSLAVTTPTVVAVGPDLPQYRFQPGQHLLYSGEEGAATGSGRFGFARDTELRVVRANADGSHTILVSQRYVRFSERDGVRSDDHTRLDEYVVDVTPQGVIADRATDTFDVLNRLLPELPADKKAARSGWSFTTGDVRHDGQIAARASGDEPWSILVEPSSVLMAMNDRSAYLTYTLHPERGVIDRISSVHRHKSRVVRTGEETLVEERVIDERSLALLASEIDAYIAADRAYEAGVDAILTSGAPEAAPAALDELGTRIEFAAGGFESALLQRRMHDLVARHRASREGYMAEAQRRGRLLHQPAPTWVLTDLAGGEHRLEDYRGRVVVLDFWYRRCGWCIRAMPQLQAVARRFADRSVAVLGINVDQDIDDARYVVDLLDIDYPTLRAERALAQAYGVRGYPTLAVVDREGVFRYLHVGYSGTLAEELGQQIEQLLATE